MWDFLKIKEIKFVFLIVIILSFFIIRFAIPKEIDYALFLSISATIVGFLITALSILLVFPNEGRINLLKEHELYPSLFDIFMFSIYSEIFLFIISLIGTLYCNCIYLEHIFLFILLLCIALLILNLWIIKSMIKILFKKN